MTASSPTAEGADVPSEDSGPRLLVQLPDPLYAEVWDRATGEGRTMADVARAGLRLYLDQAASA